MYARSIPRLTWIAERKNSRHFILGSILEELSFYCEEYTTIIIYCSQFEAIENYCSC